ncbi:MAG TPA: YdeI/OmpD-associated family protein [Flavisolibacter sp.]|nr:YdeI/OmpD-associated family protein [Flavisolibacter sp.]
MHETEIFHAKTISAWRAWLAKHHLTKQSVWLVCYNKNAVQKSISWSDAVDVALCYGWIDSKKIKIDEETSHQFFSRRKAKSTWSKINKDKIEKLTEAGLMAEAGLKAVEVAKQNGSWSILDEVENLTIPTDLQKALKAQPGAEAYFAELSKSVKKAMLQWLVLAKRAGTRQARITEIANCAGQGTKPKQF